MTSTQGMGSCLIPTLWSAEHSCWLPCGRQIEDGESIGTVLSFAGPLVGHRDCADAFEKRERNEKMVRIGRQQGAGGPMPGPEQYKDGIMGSIPLEKPPEPTGDLPPGVTSVADVPFEEKDMIGSPIPDYAASPHVGDIREDGAVWVGDYWAKVEDHPLTRARDLMVAALAEINKYVESR
jgi:hypothetical protein